MIVCVSVKCFLYMCVCMCVYIYYNHVCVCMCVDSADKSTVMMEKTAKENTVDILGLESPFYMPNTITVSAGVAIAFDNVDANYHTVTSGTSEFDGKFDSGLLEAGDSYELTIDEPGTYDYFCSLHTNMKGIIIVS